MDSLKPEDSTGSQGSEQPDKPLGRGLEQISHLFLTHRINGPTAGGPSPTSAVRTVLLRPNTSITKDRLVAVLRESPCALAEELRVIDVFVPCHPHSDIDLLALDRSNQLTLIDLETSLNDALVVRGLGHHDWLQHNLPSIRRMYPGQAIALASQPRLFLIAPSFSSMAMSAARQLTQMQIHSVRYHAFDTGSTMGIYFEPITRD